MGKNREVIDRKFGWRDKLGYLFGDFGNDFTFILSSSFLLKFYTDVMGISAAVVGVVMMVPRFFYIRIQLRFFTILSLLFQPVINCHRLISSSDIGTMVMNDMFIDELS